MTVAFPSRFPKWLVLGLIGSLIALTLFVRASFATVTNTPQESLIAPAAPQAWPDNRPWAAGFYLPGTNGIVHATIIDANGDLIVGGQFSVAGKVDALNIARWDGTNWHPLGTGTNNIVYALAVDSDGTLYAGGNFTSAGTCATDCKRIAAWNGTTWSALGTGIDGPGGTVVYTLALNSQDQLYAGGSFAIAGDCLTNCVNIAQWNGTSWGSLHQGVPGIVHALDIDSSNNVYVGGSFPNINGCADCLNIGRWSGTSWHELDNGVAGTAVYALAVDADENVYVGGDFISAGSACATCIQLALWDSFSWSDTGFDSNFTAQVTELAVSTTDKLYVYAEMVANQGLITTLQASVWSNFVTDSPVDVNALVIDSDGEVFIGGGFNIVGECWSGCVSIAQFNGSIWNPLGEHGRGPDGYPAVLAVAPNGDIYLGGFFEQVGTCTDCWRVVRWDGTRWHPVGSYPHPLHEVTVMAFDSAGNLYAGGFGGVSKWDGSVWTFLGADIFAPIYSMVVDENDTLYIGGAFIVQDCIECYNIAKWGGTAWEPLDIGIPDPVRALAVDSDNTLYVGGDFPSIWGSTADCNDCAYLATWSGTAWEPLSTRPDGPVRTLAVDSDNTLYAGGSFTSAGTCFSNCQRIAKWNGTLWSSLENGMNNIVETVAVSNDGTLVAGGRFTSAGTCTSGCNYLARWNGTTWEEIDNGMDGWVTKLVINRVGGIHAIGQFSHAGNQISRNYAMQSGGTFLPVILK